MLNSLTLGTVLGQQGYKNGLDTILGSVVGTLHDVHLRQLQRVLNAAARLIARKRKYDSISATLRDALHWLPIRQRVEFKLSVLVFNCMHNLAPSYLSTMCQPVLFVFLQYFDTVGWVF